jgi:hypothetical protein
MLSLSLTVFGITPVRAQFPWSTTISCPAADVILVNVIKNQPNTQTLGNGDERRPELSVVPIGVDETNDSKGLRSFKVIYTLPIHSDAWPEYSLPDLELDRPMTQLAFTPGGVALSGGLVRLLSVHPIEVPNDYRVELLVVPHQRSLTVEARWPERRPDAGSWLKYGPDARRRLDIFPIAGTDEAIQIDIDTELFFKPKPL